MFSIETDFFAEIYNVRTTDEIDARVLFAVFGDVRVETVTVTVAGPLELENFATVVELVAPPTLVVEYFFARTFGL